MRNLILNSDVRRLYAGVAAAAVAGLACGALMYPDLRGPGDAEGAQLLAGTSGARSYADLQSANWAGYQGKVPDYVVGTDYLYPPQPAAYVSEPDDAGETSYADVMAYEAPPEEAEPPSAYAAEAHAAVAVHVGAQDEESALVSYPSVSGGVPYGVDLPPPPEPPRDDTPIISG